jgi:hypothetical protein
MNNKNLLIGAGIVVVGYLLWKKSQSNSVANSGVVTPKPSIRPEEKIDLFNKAIQRPYQGGAYNPRIDEMIKESIKINDLANAKIKELKLDAEFSTWLNARPKVDYGMYPPN